MANFIKLVFIAFSDVDPFVFIAPICLVLVVLIITALWQLGQIRLRLQHQSGERKLPFK